MTARRPAFLIVGAARCATTFVLRASLRARPPQVDRVLLDSLEAEFAPEIARLGALIGRDLATEWRRTGRTSA